MKALDIRFAKLHFGCGSNRIEGWSNFDIEMDLRQPLPIPNDSIRLVFAEHVIEHLTPADAWSFFKEVRRILVPGGGVRFIVPCVDFIQQRYDKEYGNFIAGTMHGDGSLEAAVGSIILNWGHKTIWTVSGMQSILKALGFDTWECVPSKSRFPEAVGIDDHARCIGEHANWVESGVVEAAKPWNQGNK